MAERQDEEEIDDPLMDNENLGEDKRKYGGDLTFVWFLYLVLFIC
jgi:hypothetical protein